MTSSRIPWDAPSRYGRAGLLARGLLRRLARPVTVRVEAEQNRLKQELSALRTRQSEAAAQSVATAAQLAQASTCVGTLSSQVAALTDKLDRLNEYATAADRVVDTLLFRDLPADTRQTRLHRDSHKGAICSVGAGYYQGLLARSAISYERYAERWGWDLVLSTEQLAQDRPLSWGKIPFLRSLMDDYEWLLWLDADVVVVDLDADIREEIRDDKDLYLVEHQWGQYTANAGVMLIRSCPWSRNFLDQVWELGSQYSHHPWWENAAVLHLLGYALQPARLVQPTVWLRRAHFLDARWNSLDVQSAGLEMHRADHPVFVHRGLYDVATRSRQITGDLTCVLAGAHPLTAGSDRPARRVRHVTDVRRREELPLLLNTLGLTRTGAEIGVWKGEFSEHILKYWRGERLISIDPWLAAPSQDYVDILNVSQDEHDSYYAEAARRLARFGERSTIWRRDSLGARALLRPDGLDFVYLDARHDEASVRKDLETWWPVVRPGGLLCGHDYLDGLLPEGLFGVRTAVDAFFGQLGLGVHATLDDAPWSSWIVVKPAS